MTLEILSCLALTAFGPRDGTARRKTQRTPVFMPASTTLCDKVAPAVWLEAPCNEAERAISASFYERPTGRQENPEKKTLTAKRRIYNIPTRS